ncbi:cytochrome P450 family protein [Pseudonocardia acaciae]|uniref:cytochrome P450 family protein n=1 Tax=Pseudonocardia acaciae TaxID=551276 RepID=UPI000AA08A08|nr:cytochrome P450 [Pseudonocardia acaciae]
MTSTNSRMEAGEPEGLLELGPDFMTDPHALYPLLRRERPVVAARSPQGLRIWLVTRYRDVRAALNDPRLGKDAAHMEELLRVQSASQRHRSRFALDLTSHMLNSDPPDHTRLRKLVNRAFTGRAIAALRPRIEAIATELADSMAAGPRTVDLIDTFAFPMPLTVICEILGVAIEDRDAFRAWSNTTLSAAPLEERKAAATAMGEYMVALVADKRERPGDDMLSEIVRATESSASGTSIGTEDADRLSTREAVSMAFLLLLAGHETTVNLISNGMLALLRHPDRLAELRADPDLTPSAVEEFLRYDGPLNLATFRHTLEPVTIAGTEIPAGEVVIVSLASANRDPDRYDRPDELDLHRDAPNLAFGHGIHHCLGAPLARLEGDVAFRTLLGRFPAMSLAVEPAELSWRDSTLIRGLTRLPVRLDG